MNTSEAAFQTRLLAKLRALPWSYWVKIQCAQNGTPDILGCIGGRFVGLELKKDQKSKPTKLQTFTLEKIDDAGGYARVVRPDDAHELIDQLKSESQI